VKALLALLLGGAFVWRPSPLLLIAVIAIPEAWRALRDEGRPDGYCEARLGQRPECAALYVGLLVLPAVMGHDVHDMLATARP